MADVFIAAVAEIGAAIGGVSGATAIMYSVEIGTALYYTAVVAASVTYGNSRKRAAARQARDAYNASLRDRLVMVPVLDGGRSRIYGIVRNVDGIAFKASRGANREFYTLVVSLSGHEIDGFEAFYIDDEPVTLDAQGYVTTSKWRKQTTLPQYDVFGAPGLGQFVVQLSAAPDAGTISITGTGSDNEGTGPLSAQVDSIVGNQLTYTINAGFGPFVVSVNYQSTDAKPRIRIRSWTGAAGQDLSTDLVASFPGVVNASDRFSIGAQLMVDLEYDPDVFVTGVPTFSAVMRGARVLDHRTGQVVFTRNPALIGSDWARYKFGGGIPADAELVPMTIAAANTCDIAKTFTSAGRTFTGPQYACDIAIPLGGDQAASRVMDDIVNSMAGRWCWSGGALAMRAGGYRAPAITIDESWLAGTQSLRLLNDVPAGEAINTMRARFVDASQHFQAVPSALVPDAAFLAEDGGQQIMQEITLPGVTDELRVGHVLSLMIRERRFAFNGSLPLKLHGLQLQAFTVARLLLPTFGVDATIEILDWGFSQQGGITAVFKDARAAIWDPLAQIPAQAYSDNTTRPDPRDVPILALTVTSGPADLLQQADGTIVSRIRVRWSPVLDRTIAEGGAIVIGYKLHNADASAWQYVEVPGDAREAMLAPVLDDQTYMVQARARNRLVTGRWSPMQAVKAVAKTARPPAVAGLTVALIGINAFASWTPPAFDDYLRTVVRLGSPLGTIIYAGAANGFPFIAAEGSSTIYATHFNRSGWESLAPQAFTFNAAAVPASGNLIDSSWWKPGADWLWQVVQSPNTAEVSLVYAPGPSGAIEVVVEATSVDSQSNPPQYTDDPDGGWAYAGDATPRNLFIADHGKAYRFAVPVFRVNAAASYAYWGLACDSTVKTVGGADDTNPYFAYSASLPVGRWLLFVGYVFPSGAAPTGATNDGAGIYDMATGELLQGGSNFVWPSNVTKAGTRAFQYYGEPGAKVRFGRPQVFLLNGGEPPLFDKLAPALLAASNAQATADGKIATFYGTVPPVNVGEDEGDLWFDTDDGMRQYRHTSGAWQLVQDGRIGQALIAASTAQSTADGKVAVFFNVAAAPPVAEGLDDLWFVADQGFRLKAWNGTAWTDRLLGSLALGANSITDQLFATGAQVGVFRADFVPTLVAQVTYTADADCSVTAASYGHVEQVCFLAQWSTVADITDFVAPTILGLQHSTVCRNRDTGDKYASGALAIEREFIMTAGETKTFRVYVHSGGFAAVGPQAGCDCTVYSPAIGLIVKKR